MALVKRAGKAEDEILKFSARIANLAGFCRYFRRYFNVRNEMYCIENCSVRLVGLSAISALKIIVFRNPHFTGTLGSYNCGIFEHGPVLGA